jgi:hypothetical protein
MDSNNPTHSRRRKIIIVAMLAAAAGAGSIADAVAADVALARKAGQEQQEYLHLTFAATSVAAQSAAQHDVFLNLEGIAGETKDR